jgi:hypothetical protein
MIEPSVIVQALIAPPAEFGDTATVLVRLSGASEFIQLLSYYDDEISFTAEELVGLTVDEARQLHFEKDKAWLQS